MNKQPAILVLGPTGAGKTPLGEYLQRHGLWGRRCVHFDFGSELRRIAGGGRVPGVLTPGDMATIEHSLRSGALLENEDFHIAAAILGAFVRRRHVGPEDMLVMNGLPRHLGQAADTEGLVDFCLVVLLDCVPGVLFERIQTNAGGDRTVRADDSPTAVACKLKIFQERTVPLVEHYRRREIRVETVRVGVDTAPADVVAQLGEEGDL